MPEVNWLAVLVCGVASMVLGSLWYGPLFGKMWMEMTGFNNMDPARREEMKKGMVRSYSLAFIGALIMAYILSHVITYASNYNNVSGVSAGLSSAFWMWLGFIVPSSMGMVLWEGKPWKYWFLNASYYLIQLLVFGLILGSWR